MKFCFHIFRCCNAGNHHSVSVTQSVLSHENILPFVTDLLNYKHKALEKNPNLKRFFFSYRCLLSWSSWLNRLIYVKLDYIKSALGHWLVTKYKQIEKKKRNTCGPTHAYVDTSTNNIETLVKYTFHLTFEMLEPLVVESEMVICKFFWEWARSLRGLLASALQ